MKRLATLLALFCMLGSAAAQTPTPTVALETSFGRIVIQLDNRAAPRTVANFLDYVNSGFYNGTIFHRVIKGFMIQGGGLNAALNKKATLEPIPNEAQNGLKNLRGTIAMARTQDPHSATAQFFINTVDNAFLNFRSQSQQGWGYCVFGRVVEGMEVVDRIEGLATTVKNGRRDVPVEAVVITSARVIP